MENVFKEQISIANIFLQEHNFKKALQSYEDALAIAETTNQKIDLYKVMGRLYQKMKHPELAAAMFEESLKLYHDAINTEQLGDKAAIYNNLGAIYVTANLKNAIENYKTALNIYKDITETGNTSFLPHLANTNFALAEAYTQKNDLFLQKNTLKRS
jgi:Tfp pilus assembly protein PilF